MSDERDQLFGRAVRHPQPKRERHIVMTPDEWAVFHAACMTLGVAPTGAHYWAWRLNEAPFNDAVAR